jgi:hypothetical protein
VPLALAVSCAVPPHPADPTISEHPVRLEHWRAGVLRVHVMSVNGARIPERALERSLATIAHATGLGTEVHHEPDLCLAPDAEGLFADPLPWPVREAGHELSLDDLARTPGRRRLLSEPQGGIVGVVVKTNFAAEPVLYPLIEPGVMLVAVVPGNADGSGVTGYTARSANAPEGEMFSGLVVLRASAIARVANWFISEDRLWEWTLTHEAGHVFGVPARNSHMWIVPGLGAHCTRPDCVMYTGVDWRVVLSGLLHGWPLDYCGICAKELDEARALAAKDTGVTAPAPGGSP